jgi:AcrR family transcriptional regulator
MKKRAYDMTSRAAKAAGTKQRICESTVALYAERSIEEFTLDDVAEGADTTVQTVLRIFGSKDELVYEALSHLGTAGGGIRPTPRGDVAAAVRAIFEVYESIGDLVIRRLADALRRPQLRPALEDARGRHRLWVKQAFAPQLERVRGAARTHLYHALVVATDVGTWNVLRRDTALSRTVAEAVVRQLIDGVITREERNNGSHPVAELVGRR